MINKKQAIKIIVESAMLYKENFLNKNLLIISQGKDKIYTYEMRFSKTNFLHLTGVKLLEINGYNNAGKFFDDCINHRLSERSFDINPDGTTELKLKVLTMLLSKNMKASIIGDYSEYNPKLYTEKLAGGIRGCLGFVKDKNGYYVPNTVLNVDIRDKISNNQRILVMAKKLISDEKYSEIVYTAKGVELQQICTASQFEYLKQIKWDLFG